MALCALWPQRSIPRLDHGIWPETSGQGVGFVEAFLGREGKGNCFDWPKCYCSFESAGLFSLFKRSWVFISNTHSPEMTRSVLTANKRQRTRCLATSETHAHICIRPHSVWETRNLMYFLFCHQNALRWNMFLFFFSNLYNPPFLPGTISLCPDMVTWPRWPMWIWALDAQWWTFAGAIEWKWSVFTWSRRWATLRKNSELCWSSPTTGSGFFTSTVRCAPSWAPRSWNAAAGPSTHTVFATGTKSW